MHFQNNDQKEALAIKQLLVKEMVPRRKLQNGKELFLVTGVILPSSSQNLFRSLTDSRLRHYVEKLKKKLP